jgi:uncharacterized protein YjiS (DUF1127 family)
MNGSIDRERVMRSETARADRSVCQPIISIVAGLWSALVRLHRAKRARAALEALDDRMLKDIGVSRAEIEWVAEHGDARELLRVRSLEACRQQAQRSDASASGGAALAPKENAGATSGLVDLAAFRASSRRAAATNAASANLSPKEDSARGSPSGRETKPLAR